MHHGQAQRHTDAAGAGRADAGPGKGVRRRRRAQLGEIQGREYHKIGVTRGGGVGGGGLDVPNWVHNTLTHLFFHGGKPLVQVANSLRSCRQLRQGVCVASQSTRVSFCRKPWSLWGVGGRGGVWVGYRDRATCHREATPAQRCSKHTDDLLSALVDDLFCEGAHLLRKAAEPAGSCETCPDAAAAAVSSAARHGERVVGHRVTANGPPRAARTGCDSAFAATGSQRPTHRSPGPATRQCHDAQGTLHASGDHGARAYSLAAILASGRPRSTGFVMRSFGGLSTLLLAQTGLVVCRVDTSCPRVVGRMARASMAKPVRWRCWVR